MAQNINRLLTRPLTRVLTKTPLSANQVTLLGLCTGLAAGPLIAQNRWELNIAGALLFELYALLDNCDGDIARLKNQQSLFGDWFDIVSDAVVHNWLYIWLFVWTLLYHPSLKGTALGALFGIFCTYSLGLLAHYRGFSISANPESWRKSQDPRTFRQWLGLNLHNENFSLLLLVIVLFNLKIPFLWATAIGANIYWIRLLKSEWKRFFPA